MFSKMAPPGKKGDEREGWEEMDTSSDQRLPFNHTILFVINALALSAVPICLSPPISYPRLTWGVSILLGSRGLWRRPGSPPITDPGNFVLD